VNIKNLEPAIDDLRAAVFAGRVNGRQKKIEKAFNRMDAKLAELKRPWYLRLWAWMIGYANGGRAPGRRERRRERKDRNQLKLF
jgi:hypothetical protein